MLQAVLNNVEVNYKWENLKWPIRYLHNMYYNIEKKEPHNPLELDIRFPTRYPR